MDFRSYKIADLLPHETPMVLVDEVVDWQEDGAAAVVEVKDTSLFYNDEFGVPAHVGLEYMAQTCGIYSGIHLLENNLPVRMGFLLGTRNYHSNVEWFQHGDKLLISIKEVLRQQNLGVFDCRISSEDKELAAAQLTVYQSDDKAVK